MPKVVDHEARRLEISGVTARLIARGGVEAATIREIARESGFSKGVLEHYFDNKEALIAGALAWCNREYEQRVELATAGLSGLEAMRRRMEATLPLDDNIRDEWKVRLVFWSIAAIDEDLRKTQQLRTHRAIERFETDLHEALANGEIGAQVDVDIEARRLVHIITGLSTAALHNHVAYSPEFLGREITQLIDRLRGSAG